MEVLEYEKDGVLTSAEINFDFKEALEFLGIDERFHFLIKDNEKTKNRFNKVVTKLLNTDMEFRTDFIAKLNQRKWKKEYNKNKTN